MSCAPTLACPVQPKDSGTAQQPASGNFMSGAAVARDRRARAANRRSSDTAIARPPLNKANTAKVLLILL